MTPDELEPDNQGTVPDIFSSICMSNEQVCRSLAPERSYLVASHCIALHRLASHCIALHVGCKGNRIPNIPD